MKHVIYYKIFVLNQSKNSKRRKNIIKLFDSYNIDFDFWYSQSLAYETDIIRTFNATHKSFHNSYEEYFNRGSVFNVCQNFYSICKHSYEMGYNNILICEDDIYFIDGFNKEMLYNIPKDADITRFNVTINYNLNYNESFYKPYNDKFSEFVGQDYPKTNYGSCLCVSLNRNDMKHYIDFINKFGYLAADYPYMYFKKLNNNIKQYIINPKLNNKYIIGRSSTDIDMLKINTSI